MSSLLNPTRPTTPRAEAFRCKLRGLRRSTLLKNVDVFLEQADSARARGDRQALAWAEVRWNLCWDEIDRRDGLPVEAA